MYWNQLLGKDVDDKFKEFVNSYMNSYRKNKHSIDLVGKHSLKTPSDIISTLFTNSKESLYTSVFQEVFTVDNIELSKVDNIEFIGFDHNYGKSYIRSFDIKFKFDIERSEGLPKKHIHAIFEPIRLNDEFNIKSIILSSIAKSYIIDGINSNIKTQFRENRISKKKSGVNLKIGDLFNNHTINYVDINSEDETCTSIISFQSIFIVE